LALDGAEALPARLELGLHSLDYGIEAELGVVTGRQRRGGEFGSENESDWEASERPQHEVTIAKPFAVSKFEVTFEEWDACVAVDSTIDQIIHLRTNHLAPAAASGIEGSSRSGGARRAEKIVNAVIATACNGDMTFDPG